MAVALASTCLWQTPYFLFLLTIDLAKQDQQRAKEQQPCCPHLTVMYSSIGSQLTRKVDAHANTIKLLGKETGASPSKRRRPALVSDLEASWEQFF
jgi:hypothetical protein